MSVLRAPSFISRFPPKKMQEAVPGMVDALAAQFPYASAKPKSEIVILNHALLGDFGVDAASLDDELFQLLTAQQQGEMAFAYNYGGHQFGHWADQLGDGRAVVIGEARLSSGTCHEWQLKGSGKTPFSRRGDGKAVMRSSIREYIASEALYALGIPTTRALVLMATGESVLRDRFYDGSPAYEDGAILCRTAPSFLRFGHFELLASRQQEDLLRSLLGYCSELLGLDAGAGEQDVVPDFLTEVSARTAKLIAQWQAFGFVHGVMNTDNLSILGLTIDYGPYGFMEHFDPLYTPNTSDLPGRRYRYEQQPAIAFWNLQRLAECFLSMTDRDKLVPILEDFPDLYQVAYDQALCHRLGLRPDQERHKQAAYDYVDLVAAIRADVNFLTRQLSESIRDDDSSAFFAALNQYYPNTDRQSWQSWFVSYQALLQSADPQVDFKALGEQLCRINPRFVPKNHVLYQIETQLTQGNRAYLDRVLALVAKPFDDWPAERELFEPAPEWACARDVQMNSCSS